jgi:D-beta-D-heptose 7-phosphate kinase/D-beta-D-heptose 1-phosphate adenosyltransferase
MTELLGIIERLEAPEVLVVGDLILDRYVAGSVERVSPEAPIQVLRHEREWTNPGGMAAVANNLARLGARVRIAGVVGNDPERTALLQTLGPTGIGFEGVVVDPSRPTTVKTRLVAARQQLLRVDRETSAPLAGDVSERLLASVRDALVTARYAVLSDYGKGVLHDALCRELVAAARKARVPVIVDPKGRDFSKYRGVTAITPNRSEAAAATGLPVATADDARRAGERLLRDLDLETAYITLDRDGIYVLERGGEGTAIRTAAPREVFDVTGAGDNVIAVLACALAGGVSPVDAATLANIAGGIAVEHFGVVTVGWDEIAARLAGGDAKLLPPALLRRLLESARRSNRKIVFTNGCFDILHPGHVDFLRRSRALGDLLVVGLNDDASVRRLKGEGRPVNDLRSRATVLGGLASVDYVVAFPEDTPAEILREVRPDVLVKGEDWKDKGVVGREFVESYGGRVELLPLVPGHSTTSIVDRLGKKR